MPVLPVRMYWIRTYKQHIKLFDVRESGFLSFYVFSQFSLTTHLAVERNWCREGVRERDKERKSERESERAGKGKKTVKAGFAAGIGLLYRSFKTRKHRHRKRDRLDENQRMHPNEEVDLSL